MDFAGKRKYSLNEDFFLSINTEEKAYWLGFFLADGCKTEREIRINIKEQEHLKKFLADIDSDRPLYIDNRGYALVAIKSRKLVASVAKTWEEVPNISNILLRHFWRGVFDGDGHIGYHNNPQRKSYQTLHCILVGEKATCAQFKSFIIDNSIDTKANVIKHNTANCWKFATSGNKLVKSIHSLLYDNSSVSLDRKRMVV